jgi:GNAT superfamily N-acetyltransferase
MGFSIRIETAASPAARALAAALDALIERLYPGIPANGVEADFDARGGVYAIGYADGVPAASGAFRDERGVAEFKRMFVAPEFRRRGYAKAMLAFLEAEAARRGYERAILETGIHQQDAVGLYRSAGWETIDCYGVYTAEPVSLCFGKRLAAPAEVTAAEPALPGSAA